MRIELAVEMKGIYSYTAPAYGYGVETRYIYKMATDCGNIYVWKTAAIMAVSDSPVNVGDKLVIVGTVKGESEYRGENQTELTRVKVKERTFRGKTWEEIQKGREEEKERKAQEQRDSIRGMDIIWTMTYKQYKEHYSDCETITGSFRREMGRPATIQVIIREGRLKASGVRGKHYSGYVLEDAEDGKRVVYRAVSEENAVKRAEKEFGGGEWKCVKIYQYAC